MLALYRHLNAYFDSNSLFLCVCSYAYMKKRRKKNSTTQSIEMKQIIHFFES